MVFMKWVVVVIASTQRSNEAETVDPTHSGGETLPYVRSTF